MLIVVLLVMMLGAGAVSFHALNIEAYPDPVPPLVDVVTQSSGQSAEEIERYITIPLEIQMAGIPNVQAIRTISLFGLSDVKIQFTYDFTYYQAEQWVTNRLSQLGALPNGAQPQISPTSPIGEIFRYRVVGPPDYSVTDLKTLEDWVLERRFKAVPGVIDVTGWGGKTKTYDIAIDQHKLMAYGLSVPQVLPALGNANINVGGQTVNFGAQAAVVRGVGLIHSADEIRQTLIANNQGAPVVIGDVAKVTHRQPAAPRHRRATTTSNDIVQGIVLMRRGAESMPTIKRVEAEVDLINRSGILPPGVSIQRIYDRSDLINITTHTVLHNMVAGIVLIFLLQWVFLGNLRSAIIVATTIPFALSFAIGLMVLRGESANLLSVGAIDFGLVVDATVIMVENIFRHLAEASAHRGTGPSQLHRMRVPSGFRGKMGTVSLAAAEVSQSIFFAAAIIIAGFVPLFTLSGIEGHIFGPMAKTYAYAIAGGLIATFTIAPALSLLLFPQVVSERETLGRARLAADLRAGARVRARQPHHRLCRSRIDRAVGDRGHAFAGPGVPAQARGRQSLGSRDIPPIRLARGQRRLCESHAGVDEQVSGGSDGGLAAWPAGRRHRCDRFLQCGVLRAAQAVRHLARRDRQGKAHAADDRGARERFPGRRRSISRSTSRTTSRRPHRE